MADFVTHERIHGVRFHATQVRDGHHTFRDLYRETAPLVFKNERVKRKLYVFFVTFAF